MRTVKNIDIKVLTKAPVMEIEGVQYHHHLNGGGLVAETAQVEDSVYIGPCAKVCGHCKVSGDVLIFGHAWLSGTAEVSGRAQIFGNARVFDNARIRDDAKVCGSARVHGNAEVTGFTEISKTEDIGETALADDQRVSAPGSAGPGGGNPNQKVRGGFIESFLSRMAS